MFVDRCRLLRGLAALAAISLVGMLATVCAEESGLHFPSQDAEATWEAVLPADANFHRTKLDEVLDFARRQRSSGLVILYRGRILAEGHWNPDDLPADATQKAKGKARLRSYEQRVIGRDGAGRAIEDVASAQKSVSAILAGLAQERGLFRITDSVQKHLGRGWSKASPEQEAIITIRHLLTMTSGLDDDLEFEAPPGTRWYYNSTVYSRVLMCTASAAKLDRNELTKQWLTGPLGMQDSRWENRPLPAGVEARNGVGFATTARDLARFGLLIQANGDWNGRTIIKDKQFLHDALHPSQELNPSYGYLWWLNGQPKVMRGRELIQGPLIPTAPPDLVAALGALQRKVYVVPSENVVVTRIGDNCPPLDTELWRLITAAMIGK
jgi:CubicO group peptidase (beta-lactamase class C family)